LKGKRNYCQVEQYICWHFVATRCSQPKKLRKTCTGNGHPYNDDEIFDLFTGIKEISQAVLYLIFTSYAREV